MTKRTEKKTEEELMKEYLASDPELSEAYMALIQSNLDAYKVWKANPTPENEQLLDAARAASDDFEFEHHDYIRRDPSRTPEPPGHYEELVAERRARQGDKQTEKH
jgi:hypothetical protein